MRFPLIRRHHPDDREIWRLALPALGALAAEPLYVLTDTAVVGHLGTPQLGGLAVAGTLLTTGFWVFNFLSYGTTAAVARSIGAGDERAAARHAVQALWMGLAIGVALIIAGVLAAPALVGLMGPSAAVRPNALTYLRISLFGAPSILLGLVGVGYLRGLQDTATPLWIALGANVANLVLEVTLIFGLGFGLAASAWATVAAQTSAGALFAAFVARHVSTTGVSWRPDLAAQLALARVGRDLFVRTGSLLAALAITTSVASRLGTVELAAHQIAFQLWSFLALVLDAVAIAAQAMIGRLLGAGQAEAARSAARRMIEWGVVAGIGVGLVVAGLRPVLVPLFTADPAVGHLAARVLWFVAAIQPINAIVFVLDGVLIGAGDLRFLAAAALGILAVFLPAALSVAAFDLSLPALWGALTLLMVARLVAVTGRFAGDRWAVTGPGGQPAQARPDP
jgi:putative MATE family efflux protein